MSDDESKDIIVRAESQSCLGFEMGKLGFDLSRTIRDQIIWRYVEGQILQKQN
jgi:hypothetical protein